MNIVVADASFCAAWILPDEKSAVAERILEKILSGQVELRVPALWSYEMSNLLRSAYRRGRLKRKDLFLALETLANVPLRVFDVPDSATQSRILELALIHNLSAYDAAYLELAKRFKVELHSCDHQLLKASRS